MKRKEKAKRPSQRGKTGVFLSCKGGRLQEYHCGPSEQIQSNVKREHNSERKSLGTTFFAQFAALPLVKMVLISARPIPELCISDEFKQ